MRKPFLSRTVGLYGALAILLAGCSASHTVTPSSVLPGPPGPASQDVAPFRLNTKNIIYQYPLPNSNSEPNNMALGSDKNVWFTEYDAPRVGKITQAGVVSEYSIPSGGNAFDIAPGATGTLWFTEPNFMFGGGGPIGKITTNGDITEYPGPADGDLFGITRGPDGNMWFTDYVDTGNMQSRIGYITPTGTVTEYEPAGGIQPGRDIVAGPDGNLWFTASDSSGLGYVGKSTTSGTITTYAGPSDNGFSAIVAGPDGNLYATSDAGIWRITTAGTITEYAAPFALDWSDIVVGPDKQLWMTSFTYGWLIAFNPKTNTFSNPLMLSGSKHAVDALTVGEDGDVWLSGFLSNSIFVYEEKIALIGIRLNGELSFTDPNYGFELGYAVGIGTQTQTISLRTGESVEFKNLDTIPHSAAFLGNATANSAPWPRSFNGSSTQSPAGTAIGTSGWATGSLNANAKSPVYETGLPGFYMIGDQYDYTSNNMRTVIIVH
jgi:virginiamycin B lyase